MVVLHSTRALLFRCWWASLTGDRKTRWPQTAGLSSKIKSRWCSAGGTFVLSRSWERRHPWRQALTACRQGWRRSQAASFTACRQGWRRSRAAASAGSAVASTLFFLHIFGAGQQIRPEQEAHGADGDAQPQSAEARQQRGRSGRRPVHAKKPHAPEDGTAFEAAQPTGKGNHRADHGADVEDEDRCQQCLPGGRRPEANQHDAIALPPPPPRHTMPTRRLGSRYLGLKMV